MNSGFYAACAGLVARNQALDITANNLANVNTTGFRSQAEVFRSLVAGAENGTENALNRAINDFAVIGGSFTTANPGHLETTGNPLDLAIEGSGFFAVQTKAGVRYTRNGNFRIDTQGTLLSANGDPVLGQAGPIRLPSGLVSVGNDGTVSVAQTVVGRLQLVDVDPQNLKPVGNNYFEAADGTTPTPATYANVHQGMLESSNIEPVSAAVNLIALQRHTDFLQRTLRVFYSDFDRTAVEQLASVT
jgi:flagellar basal-body rod protein FlgF/flagellar basal-body rod protein FlgG